MSTVDYQLSSALCLRDNKTAMMGVKTAGDSRPKPWTPVSLTIPGSTPKPTAGPTICGRHGIWTTALQRRKHCPLWLSATLTTRVGQKESLIIIAVAFVFCQPTFIIFGTSIHCRKLATTLLCKTLIMTLHIVNAKKNLHFWSDLCQ